LPSSADSLTATIALATWPTGATAGQITAANAITLTSVDTTSATIPVNPVISAKTITIGGVGTTYGQSISGRTTISVTPTLAGVYTYKITPGSTTYPSTATALTWTVTVGAKAKATAASVGNTAGSTLVYGPSWNYNTTNSMGGTYADPTATSTAALVTAGGVSCAADLGYGNPCVTGRIVLSNGATASGSQMTSADAEKLTYVVTGPGIVRLNTEDTSWTGALTTQGSTVAYETSDSWTGTPTSLTKTFVIYTIGIPGKISVKITSGTTTIATVEAIAFGNAKTITPTVVKNPILASVSSTGAITAVVKDELGNPVRGTEVFAVSSVAGSVTNSYTSCGVSTTLGAVSCDLLAGATAGTSSITLTTNSSAAGTGISAAPVSVRVSDGVVTMVDYSFTETDYQPGYNASLVATVSNAAGIMPAGSYTVLSAGVTSNYAATGLPTTTVLAVGNTGKATYTVAIPSGIFGEFTLAGTTATGITGTFGKANVSNLSMAALEAAQDATDAAAAAYDAAVSAGDAADAATAAAQDAADAVATLSVQVATLIKGLKAQLTALTNLVIKIQKKVKA
jgi:hypothetical protein